MTIERRKFVPFEKKVKQFCTISLYILFVGSNIAVAVIQIVRGKKLAATTKQYISGLLNSSNCIFFVVTMFLFPRAAQKRHIAAWNDYKTAFVFQSFGLALALAINVVTSVFVWVNEIYLNETTAYFALNTV